MKQVFLYSLFFIFCSILGFAGTLYFISDNKGSKQAQQPANPKVIYQEFSDLSANELVKRGEGLLKKKKYGEAVAILEMAHGKAKPRSLARRDAAIYLGDIYFTGKGRPKNIGTSYRYYSSEKLDGYRQVLYRLGVMLSNPELAQYDLPKAREYLLKAESKGIAAATKQLAKIGRE